MNKSANYQIMLINRNTNKLIIEKKEKKQIFHFVKYFDIIQRMFVKFSLF